MSHRVLAAFVVSFALAGPIAAQLLVAPEGMAIQSPSSSALIWRNSGFRLQQIYDTSHFLNQGVTGPITIDRIRFRAADGVVDPGGQLYFGNGSTTGVTVSIGTSERARARQLVERASAWYRDAGDGYDTQLQALDLWYRQRRLEPPGTPTNESPVGPAGVPASGR